MHDTLDYVSQDPIYRQYHHNEMTFSLMYAFSENFVLPLSHDEVVHGKGSLLRQDARRRLAAGSPTCARCSPTCGRIPGKQLLFMGSEFGQDSEWSDGAVAGLVAAGRPDCTAGVQRLVRDLNRVYRATPALWTQDTAPAGFSLDRRQRRRRQRVLVPALGRPTARCWPAW